MSRVDVHRWVRLDASGTLAGPRSMGLSALDAKLLDLLVCPVSKAPLTYRPELDELWCVASGLAYPVQDDIPVLLAEEARELSDDEIRSLKS